MRKRMKFRGFIDFFWDKEGGFSTAGIVLALLITICLLFTVARVYEVNSASADVQEVADAAALAAENVVAEFYIVVALCDATVLSLSLMFISTLALGVVCLCTPVTVSFAEAFFKAAEKIKDARDSFAEKAQHSLDKFQSVLPFLALTKAQSVFQANSSLPRGGEYSGVALLVPWEGEDDGSLVFDKSDDAQKRIESKSDELKERGEKAEEAAKKGRASKERAFLHDSGSQTDYCMYERAEHLAGMTGSENPFFSSVETWSFSAALDRAKVYYEKRAQQEEPGGNSVAEQSNSALRKRFYEFAIQEIQKGYVYETDESFEAYFPLLPKNTNEMRETVLYTESIYPIGNSSGKEMMHAWGGCPGLNGQERMGTGSIQQLEKGSYETCTACDFKVSSMGSVASASTNIENGFEYHYLVVAKEAEEYQKAKKEFSPSAKKVKGITNDLLGYLKEAFDQACNQRIKVSPPGKFGVVCLAVNQDSQSSFSHLASLFIADSGNLGPCVALSSAVLVKESSDEKKTIISSFFDGVSEEEAPAFGPLRILFDVWSSFLSAYTDGYDALLVGIQKALNAIPFMSESKLGDWASSRLEEMVISVGLEPADLSSPKPVLINSEHVLSMGEDSFSAKLLSVKHFASTSLLAGGNIFGDALDGIEESGSRFLDEFSQGFEIASIEIFEGAITIPITITLPGFIADEARNLFSSGIESLRNLAATVTGWRQWE